jgi:hypothetical protein
MKTPILANAIWDLIDLAGGPDCPLYTSREDHRRATLQVMSDSGCFDEAANLTEDFGYYFDQETTPRAVIVWIAEGLMSLPMQWEESQMDIEEAMK